MAVYALGHPSKQGLDIAGDGFQTKIKPVPVGGDRKWPDYREVNDFLLGLDKADIVLCPTGGGDNYIAGAFSKGLDVRWITPVVLYDIFGKGVGPEKILQLFQDKPELFRETRPDDFQVFELERAYLKWIDTEREAIALGNALQQSVIRDLELSVLLSTGGKDKWVQDRVAGYISRERAEYRANKLRFTGEVEEAMRRSREEFFQGLYDLVLTGDKKKVLSAQKKILERETASVSAWLREREKEVEKLLAVLPHNTFFEGLSGLAVRCRAGLLSAIGNPWRFPTFLHLNSYSGLKIVEGHAVERGNPEDASDLRYNRENRRIVCFDVGDKAWYHPGVLQDLYHAYKLHQYLVYFELIRLTAEWYAAKEKGEITRDVLVDWAMRLGRMRHLPLISRSKKAQAILDEFIAWPSEEGMRKLFSKEKGCRNIQMPPARIENQCKRMVGETVLRVVYYRWRAFVGDDAIPYEQDFVYMKQRKAIGKLEPPREYDHWDTVAYYRKKDREIQEAGITLPEEEWCIKRKDPETGEDLIKDRFPGLRI